MAVTRTSLLVGLLAFLCLSLGSANRILKNNDAENQLIGDDVPSGKENHPQNSNHDELKSIPTDSMAKISSINPINGDCCSYGTNCGIYPPPTCGCGGCGGCSGCSGGGGGGCSGCSGGGGGGGSSSCQSCNTCSSCQWQGCHGCQECQGCQGCQSCGCQASMDDSKVEQDSVQTGEPAPVVTIVPPAKPTDNDIKSSGGSNQDIKSNGGLV
ncbi:hypothetical protein Csa_012773 [Cucumis sativus]|uniref:Uncharacterized protein n=1 Tax=Cucumis sativus TaxID=3659 RepID=A0A0A0L3F6_CUCSA|nr:hypothetical protein Csa_012773 [Cucumis sativus]